MKKNPVTFLSALFLTLTSCSSERLAITTEAANVFSLETEAAYEKALNREAATPLASLEAGTEVQVLRDTYGKDYWACKVELENGQQGWLLCRYVRFQ